MTEAEMEHAWHEPSVNITVRSDHPWHPHSKFLQGLQLRTQEKIVIKFFEHHECMYEHRNLEAELYKTYEEND
ncbi:MAG: hypothetical protein ACK559_00865 [bacterium]